MKKILLPLLVLALFMVACNKVPTTNPDRASMLRTGKWKISAASVKMRLPNGRDTSINYFSMIPACHADDYIRFDSLNHGAVYNGGTSCSVADADSISFIWQLRNDDNIIDLFNGFTLIDSVAETVWPYHIDTITVSPLVLDTISRTPTVVLDSAFTLNFGVMNSPSVNIYNAYIASFSQSSFIMNFDFVAHYPQLDWYIQAVPTIKLDTFHYSVTYTNF